MRTLNTEELQQVSGGFFLKGLVLRGGKRCVRPGGGSKGGGGHGGGGSKGSSSGGRGGRGGKCRRGGSSKS